MKLSRALTYAVIAYLSWLAMQATHELGHIVAAWLTGGTVERVILAPLAISRTDVSPNPSPLAVAWAGPLVGAALPLFLALAIRGRFAGQRSATSAHPTSPRFRWDVVPACADFFAGFCLIANGAYIGVGSFDRIGDAGDLLRHGSPQWLLIAFGVISSITGLFVWHLATKRRVANPSDAT